LRLSDLRGKVVLLNFWGTWCGFCMADLPHEHALLKRHADRPFVMIGVNSDQDQEVVRKVCTEKGITWRSFWDGGSSQGPIATRWNVRVWPTLYLIDGDGVIRYKGDYLRSQSVRKNKDGKFEPFHFLDDAVDALLKETAPQKGT
jgi:thiol-disulfide isomerase/thioredoxin